MLTAVRCHVMPVFVGTVCVSRVRREPLLTVSSRCSQSCMESLINIRGSSATEQSVRKLPGQRKARRHLLGRLTIRIMAMPNVTATSFSARPMLGSLMSTEFS